MIDIRMNTLLLMLLAGCAIAVAAEPPARTGTLSGVVLDADQKPVAGASVFLDDFDWDRGAFHPVATTTSAGDGAFHLAVRGPVFRQRENIRIVATGFAPATVAGETFSIIPGADIELGKLKVSRGQVLSGQVFDIDGKPAANARVECGDRRFVTASLSDAMTPVYQMTTDSDGRFSTPPLPVSYAGLTVIVPGRLLPWICVPVGPEPHEELAPIHLQPSAPVVGQLIDEQGHPIAHAAVYADSPEFGTAWLLNERSLTDDYGRFRVDGLGRRIGLQISATDHVGIYWMIRGQADGLYWGDVKRGWAGDPKQLLGPVSELKIPMQSVAWISGAAVDADSGKPVHLSQVLECNFTRKPTGEVVLNGCTSPAFQQDADGTFRVPYVYPQEYHLTFSADGYQDAEAFTPPVQSMQPVTGVVARLHRVSGSAGPQIVRQTLTGTVTRDGKPVRAGIITLGGVASINDLPNVAICRGRTVLGQAKAIVTAEVHDGTYTLNVPYQDDAWCVRVEEPGQGITQLMNVSVKLNEQQKLDIAMVAGGEISGRVNGIPDRWKRETWVIAISRSGLRFESEVAHDGSFAISRLPPGEYGLKAGNDAFMDAERPPQKLADQDAAYGTPSDPWKRAVMVSVKSGEVRSKIAVEMPER